MTLYLAQLARIHQDLRHARAIGNALSALQPSIDPAVNVGYPIAMDVMTPPRESTVLEAARQEAKRVGLAYITRDGVAARAGVPPGSMCLFGSMTELKEKVAKMDPSLDDGASRNRYEAARSETDQRILDAALTLAAANRYDRITRLDIAFGAGVSPGRVSLLAGNMDGLRDAIMTEAVRVDNAAVVAQGLADKHPAAMGASDELKQAALATLSASS